MGPRVKVFARQSSETIAEYVKMGDELAKQCDEELGKEIRNRFVTHPLTMDTKQTPLQVRVTDGLVIKDLVDDNGLC